MRSSLAVRAEILKLARLLRVEPEELQYLEQVDPDDVRKLREQITEVLFTAHGSALGRLAAASKLLPIRVVATIGEKAFGPVLAARIAGLLDPARAVEMAETMPIGFLADVAVELDPRRVSGVISRISPSRIAQVTSELLSRREYVTMGCFVGHLATPAIRAAVEVMNDAELLQVAFVLESKDRLDELIGMLAPARRDALVDVAAAEGLWPEALDLLAHLSDQHCAELAGNAARRDDALLDSLIAAAQREEMWNAVLRVVRCMSESDRVRFARLKSINADGVLESITAAAAADGQSNELLELIPALPHESQMRVVRAAAKLDPEQRAVIAGRAREAGMTEQVAMLDDAVAQA